MQPNPTPKRPWYKSGYALFAGVMVLIVMGSWLDGDGTAVEAPIPAVSSSGYTPASSPADATIEEVYVAYLRAWSLDQPQVTVIDTMSDAELVDMAYVTCGALDNGATDQDLFDMILVAFADDPEIDSRITEIATLTGAAMGAFCPEHGGAVGEGEQ